MSVKALHMSVLTDSMVHNHDPWISSFPMMYHNAMFSLFFIKFHSKSLLILISYEIPRKFSFRMTVCHTPGYLGSVLSMLFM